MQQRENVLRNPIKNHLLIAIDGEEIPKGFCGQVISDISSFEPAPGQSLTVYVFGKDSDKLAAVSETVRQWKTKKTELHVNCPGIVPLNVHNVGVIVKDFFGDEKDLFEALCEEHKFQNLTESDKPGTSYRKGLYITDVTAHTDTDELGYRLLRCSTNLQGPTDNLRNTDRMILERINALCRDTFEDESVQLNHVLAQIYENHKIRKDKERKAKIKEHSDKTKDMPSNAVMAFCTFYKEYTHNDFQVKIPGVKRAEDDPFDYRFKDKMSVFPILRFRRKDMVKDPELVERFDVILYPNSVFLMPLSTNRLYTHEVVPSLLPVDKIPTRMGCVVRCSKREAVFKDGKTFLVAVDGTYVPMQQPDGDGAHRSKRLYREENVTAELMEYGNDFLFSLNQGDYLRPNLLWGK